MSGILERTEIGPSHTIHGKVEKRGVIAVPVALLLPPNDK